MAHQVPSSDAAAQALITAPLAAELRACRILVVDDSLLACRLIESILSKAGFETVAFATNGIEALEQVVVFGPDLIILDVEMPEMDGFEVCRELRRDRDTAGLPILVQTGNTEAEIRAQAFAVGANDVVAKPLQARELIARTRIQLENRLLVRNLSSHFERLEQELDAAFKMQGSLLPSRETIAQVEAGYGVGIECYAEASSELGGDIWGLWPVDERRLAFHMADFSGHGVVAALNVFRLHTLIQEHGNSIIDPARFLGHLNGLLTKVLPTGQYATMIAGYLDLGDNSLHYAAAAAPPAIVLRDAGRTEPVMIDTTGLPLGISASASYETRSLPFGPDDYLLLYSDALIESPGERTPPLAEDGLLGLVESCASAEGIESLAEHCLTQFFEQVRCPLGDDLTVVGLYRPPLKGARPRSRATAAVEPAEAGTAETRVPAEHESATRRRIPKAPLPIVVAIGDFSFLSSFADQLPSAPAVDVRPVFSEEGAVEALFGEAQRPAAILFQVCAVSAKIFDLVAEFRERDDFLATPIILVQQPPSGRDECQIPAELTSEALRILRPDALAETLSEALEAAIRTHELMSCLVELAETGDCTTFPSVSGELEFKTIDQAHMLATVVSAICPDPSCAVMGLTELMINAIEHGNLEISFEEKTELLRSGSWAEEVQRRQVDPRYQDRHAKLMLEIEDRHLRLRIQDQGSGFDAQRYLVMEPARLHDLHGRGIALANSLGFDKLEYIGCGNQVDIAIKLTASGR